MGESLMECIVRDPVLMERIAALMEVTEMTLDEVVEGVLEDWFWKLDRKAEEGRENCPSAVEVARERNQA